ncbi:MAG: DUF4412 domain-containing protein [Ignavibacteriota bacterium]
MKNHIFSRYLQLLTIALLMAMAIPALVHAQDFEGEITLRINFPAMGAQQLDILYSVKGDKLLQSADDPQAGKVNVYNDLKAGSQVIVQLAQKRGTMIDQHMIDSLSKMMKLPALIPKATGKKEKIGVYNCELYVLNLDSTQEMDIWLTKDMPKDVSQAIKKCTDAGMRSTGMQSTELLGLLDKGYAQVKMEVKVSGVMQMTNIFVKAEPKKLADALFVVPSDVTVTKFDPAMMGGGAPGQ